MRSLIVCVAAISLVACDNAAQTAAEDARKTTRAEKVALGIVATNANNGAGVRAAISEQSDIGDTEIYAAIGRLVERGVIVVTKDGAYAADRGGKGG